MANINRSQPPLHNTFGREPTLNKGGGKDKEGTINDRSSSSVGGDGAGGDDNELERVTSRHASAFRNQINKRNAKVRGKRGKRGRLD